MDGFTFALHAALQGRRGIARAELAVQKLMCNGKGAGTCDRVSHVLDFLRCGSCRGPGYKY